MSTCFQSSSVTAAYSDVFSSAVRIKAFILGIETFCLPGVLRSCHCWWPVYRSYLSNYYEFQPAWPIVFRSYFRNNHSHQHDILAQLNSHPALISDVIVHSQVYLFTAFTLDVKCLAADTREVNQTSEVVTSPQTTSCIPSSSPSLLPPLWDKRGSLWWRHNFTCSIYFTGVGYDTLNIKSKRRK